MPPHWPTRLLSSSYSLRTNDNPAAVTPNEPPTSSRGYRSKESASPSPSSKPDTTRYQPHARSSSHPQAELLIEKRQNAGRSFHEIDDILVDDALVPTLIEPVAESPTKAGFGSRLKHEGSDKTRRCMCCHSKVRFPRKLEVFRCTRCSTINDLEAIRTNRANGDEAVAINGALKPAQPSPLSIQRTRAIIHQCLQTYLKPFLEHPESPATARPAAARNAASRTTPTNELPSPFKTLDDFTIPQLPDLSPSRDLSLRLSPRAISVPRTTSSPTTRVPRRRPVPNTLVDSQPDSMERLDKHKVQTQATSQPSYGNNGYAASVDAEQERYERAKKIFRPLEDYLLRVYGCHESLNASFSTSRLPAKAIRGLSESSLKSTREFIVPEQKPPALDELPQIDPKMLLVGDFAENGDWWTGRLARKSDQKLDRTRSRIDVEQARQSKSASINWDELDRWYDCIHTAGYDWLAHPAIDEDTRLRLQGSAAFSEINLDLAVARDHVERALLKIAENLLKRPGQPLIVTTDLRFLLIILANPSLYPKHVVHQAQVIFDAPSLLRPTPVPKRSDSVPAGRTRPMAASRSLSDRAAREYLQHTGILKRVFGILACSPAPCHRHLLDWFCRLPRNRFVDLVGILSSFVNYRLSRPAPQPKSKGTMNDGGLIPDLSSSAAHTSAQLQTASGLSGAMKKAEDAPQSVLDYSEDWQLKVAARVMALLFAANSLWQGKVARNIERNEIAHAKDLLRPRAKAAGQLLSTSDFYNTLLDYHDLVADFKAWESSLADFTFCQYPFFLSMGAKIKILEFDARRQKENKAREAYFDSVTTRNNTDVNFHLKVRRECMVEDSLRQISEAVGAGQEELKKRLKVNFTGEEGIDAGGLRKEWFLLLVREIFDPNHGMFLYDDDSGNCYFNPHSFETSDQYHLVGALLGLAIYNSTILDIALPPFAFRKLLAAAPLPQASSAGGLPNAGVRNIMTYTTADLAEYRPGLAAGLEQLLRYDGDVQATFCQDFVISIPRYGTVVDVPLCDGGEKRAVTNDNRKEYVELYIRYLLDTSVSKQFEPFKRGFYTVCGGNALSLFRAEEIELLIRGSEEALDVDSLQAVAIYENWRSDAVTHEPITNPARSIPVINWFWDYFRNSTAADQRKLLLFITGSDRIPAVGATSLVLKIVGGGDGTGKEERENCGTDRFPIARTCFNMLVLWRYHDRQQMEEKLSRAIAESEGFGLK